MQSSTDHGEEALYGYLLKYILYGYLPRTAGADWVGFLFRVIAVEVAEVLA